MNSGLDSKVFHIWMSHANEAPYHTWMSHVTHMWVMSYTLETLDNFSSRLRGMSHVTYGWVTYGWVTYGWVAYGWVTYGWVTYGWVTYGWVTYGWVTYGWVTYGWVTYEWVTQTRHYREARPIGCLKLKIIVRKRATNYRALLRKMTYKDKAFRGSSPHCTSRMNESQKKCHIWMIYTKCHHVTSHTHESCRTHKRLSGDFSTQKCVTRHIWMGHVTHTNGSPVPWPRLKGARKSMSTRARARTHTHRLSVFLFFFVSVAFSLARTLSPSLSLSLPLSRSLSLFLSLSLSHTHANANAGTHAHVRICLHICMHSRMNRRAHTHMLHSYASCVAFICVTYHLHMCDMPHSYRVAKTHLMP